MFDKKFDVMGLEHVHRHCDIGSNLDGYGMVEEYAEYSKEVNQQYLCISDHGNLSCIPRQVKACVKYNLKPVFAIEAYLNARHPACRYEADYKKYVEGCSEEDRNALKKSYHLILAACSNEGYSNLVRLSSWSYTYGWGGNPRRPRMTHEQISLHKEGILATSGCYLGEIGQAFDKGKEDAAEEMLKKYMSQFGENFYLEIMLLDFAKQKPYDAWLVKMHEKYHVPILLSQDVHYCCKEDSKYQRLMLMTRGKNTVHDIEMALAAGDAHDKYFELQDTNLWMKSEDEVNSKWLESYSDVIPYEIFCQAKRTSVEFCKRCEGVTIDRSIKLPQFPDADAKLWEELVKGYKWRGLNSKKYAKRLRKEYDLLCRKSFSSYFLLTKQFTDEARRYCKEYLGWGTGDEALAVGRGSCVGFLCCYVLGITDVDPLKHDLLPERFLSDARGGRQLLLDFDPADEII